MIRNRRGVIAGSADSDQGGPLLHDHAACPTALEADPRLHAERRDHVRLVDLASVLVEVGQGARHPPDAMQAAR